MRLRNSIIKSQSLTWKKLCEDLNENVWGNGYKIVCKKFKINTTKSISTGSKLEAARKLFPQQWNLPSINEAEVPLFTLDELLEVLTKIKNKKAPGPDGLVPEVVKLLIKTAPDFCLRLFNSLLLKGDFPDIWKTAQLVLIEKPKKSTDREQSYRPICLLDGMGKVLERLLKIRLEEEIVRKGGLSPMQYGFTAGKSTIDAMLEVQKIAKQAKNDKKLCALTMVDVRNAFNSCPWKGILNELKERNISDYLKNILANYLKNRKIKVDDIQYEMTCGVPQGSVLGPTLWNVYYDPIMRIQLPPNTKAIAYADDVVLLTIGSDKNNIELEVRLAMAKISNWMSLKQLALAPEKTEVIMLVSNRATPEVTIQVGETQIKSKESAKYLGVEFAGNMKMTTHIKESAE